MKQNLLILILVAFISVSATIVTNKVTSTPVVPKHTATYISDGSRCLLDIKQFIDQRRHEGFIVKAVSFGVGSRDAGAIVVMEKY